MIKITMLGLLIGLTVVAAPLITSAQCIEVTPASGDYGDVKVGTAECQIFTIHSCEGIALIIYYIGITEDTTGAFSVTEAPDVPFIIDRWDSVEVEVTFTPPDRGPHGALLYIVSDASPRHETFINLVGAGVKGWRRFEAKIAP